MKKRGKKSMACMKNVTGQRKETMPRIIYQTTATDFKRKMNSYDSIRNIPALKINRNLTMIYGDFFVYSIQEYRHLLFYLNS